MRFGLGNTVRVMMRFAADARVSELYPGLLALVDRHAWAPSIVGFSSFASEDEVVFTAVYESDAAALGVLGDPDTRALMRDLTRRADAVDGYLLGATEPRLEGAARALGLACLPRLSLAESRLREQHPSPATAPPAPEPDAGSGSRETVPNE